MTEASLKECNHCGGKVHFIVRGDYTSTTSNNNPNEQLIRKWMLLECQVCSMPMLQQIDSIVNATSSLTHNPTLLYPTPRTLLSHLPEAIGKEYEAALQVQKISLNACAVLARRTLEVICTYEKASGRSLMEQINNLIKLDRVPPLLAEMAHLGRYIGNLGAHVTDREVTQDDVSAMLDFIETILEYLYVAPSKVETIKARLGKVSLPPLR